MSFVFDDIVFSSAHGLFMINKNKTIILDDSNSAGFDFKDSYIYRSINTKSRLNKIISNGAGPRKEKFVSDYEDFMQIHDVLVDNDALYVVCTQKNKIIKHSLDGTIIDSFSYPGKDDCMHINCITKWQGKIFFTAFGYFKNPIGHYEKTKDCGFIRELGSEKNFISGLSQPHSPLAVAENLLVANSEKREIIEFKINGEQLRSMSFEDDGYPRGLFFRDGILYIALSSIRHQSFYQSSKIVAADYEKWEKLGELSVVRLAEIYCIRSLACMKLFEHRYNLLVDIIETNKGREIKLPSIKGVRTKHLPGYFAKELYSRILLFIKRSRFYLFLQDLRTRKSTQ